MENKEIKPNEVIKAESKDGKVKIELTILSPEYLAKERNPAYQYIIP